MSKIGWLEDHLENFVNPLVGDNLLVKERVPLGYFDQEELTVIKNSWRAVKRAANGKRVLLAGRDVFIFEILARRENYPTKFMPEISRMTVSHIAQAYDFSDHFLFDTGFAGTIPRGLGMRDFSLLSYARNQNYQDYNIKDSYIQTFPRLSWSRGLALKIEKTPKYWESARMTGASVVHQELSHLAEFISAARLTIEIYKNSSPKFIQKHRPMKGGIIW